MAFRPPDGFHQPSANVQRKALSSTADPLEGMELKCLLKDLTYIRIELDHIELPHGNTFLTSLALSKSIYGFFLDYSVPCPPRISSNLSANVRIPEKAATENRIDFRYRRVVQVALNESIIDFWSKSIVRFNLSVQQNKSGKFPIRLLAKCVVSLSELLTPPFSICRNFEFKAADPNIEFRGTALIRVCLGSRIQTLNEKLRLAREAYDIRFEDVQRNHVPHSSRSRSSSRCRSHTPDRIEANGKEDAVQTPHPLHRGRRAERGVPAPQRPPNSEWLHPRASTNGANEILKMSQMPSHSQPFRERFTSNSATSDAGSDSVFAANDHRPFHPHLPLNQQAGRGYAHPHSGIERRQPPFPHRSASSSARISPEEMVSGSGAAPPKAFIQLTVHSANFLPPVTNQWGHSFAPNPFVSVRGRDGELRSEVQQMTRNPQWEWTARLTISGERRNCVIKFLHHGHDGDKPIAIVTLTLPIVDAARALFELTDISGSARHTNENPTATMSMFNLDPALFQLPLEPKAASKSTRTRYYTTDENVQHSDSEMEQRNRADSDFTSLDYSRLRRLLTPPSPPIKESSEELQAKLNKNLSELDALLKDMRK